jgi:hypothetical protein
MTTAQHIVRSANIHWEGDVARAVPISMKAELRQA